MIVKGDIAKSNVTKIIQEAFGQNFLGIDSKKLYINTQEGSEKVVVCISLTCPKTIPEFSENRVSVAGLNFDGGLDFENMGAAIVAPPAKQKVDITDEEKQYIQKLMRQLNL